MIRRKFAPFFALAFALVPFACSGAGLVGGSCRTGFHECGGICVDLGNDSDNCGACANACMDGMVCSDGICGSDPDAGTGGTIGIGGGGEGAEAGWGQAGYDGLDGGPQGGKDGGKDASACGPLDVPEHCGACSVECPEDKPFCSPDHLGSYECIPICDEPLVACGQQCVDTSIDSKNCGACGKHCESELCQDSECVGSTVGHIALLCMNYEKAAETLPNLLGNAVFLPLNTPVRVLEYTEFAATKTIFNAKAALEYSSTIRNRAYELTEAKDRARVEVSLNRKKYDVFLVLDQPNAPGGRLGEMGAAWAASTLLDSFTRAGGVVVVLASNSGTAEMHEFITNAGLFETTGETTATGAILYNRAPGDAVGLNVISPFKAPPQSCTFSTSSAPSAESVFVVTDQAEPELGNPVVVHRIVNP